MATVGRFVGYALLGLVDAAVPAAWVGVTVFFALRFLDVGPAGLSGLVAAGGVVVVGAVVGAVAAARGSRPFPIYRWWRAAWDRLWPWLP